MDALTCPLCGGPGPEHQDEKYRQWCCPLPARSGRAIGIYRSVPGDFRREKYPTAIVKDELTAALLSQCRAPWGWGFVLTPTPW